MPIMVPYDDSPLAATALERAAVLGEAFDCGVRAVTIVPEGQSYAREKGWIGPDEAFDRGTITDRLRMGVEEVVQDAEIDVRHVADRLPKGDVARRLRHAADEMGTELVCIGSENAGRIMTPLSSVGGGVASDTGYEVYLVRETESTILRE